MGGTLAGEGVGVDVKLNILLVSRELGRYVAYNLALSYFDLEVY